VYAAAFAVDARLVFGDRPKETTYRRLLSCPTLAELDETFGNQSERNYRLLLPEDHPLAAVPPMPAHDKFEQICIHERDEILTHTIRLEASNAEGAGEVVAVLGADHVPGVEKRWRSFVDGSATPPTPMETSTEPEPTGPKAEAKREKELGNAAYKAKDFDLALKHYDAAIALDDEDVSFLTNKAAVNFEKGDYDACIECCDDAIEKGRELRVDYKMVARAMTRKGNALVKKDMLEEAIEVYAKSLMEHRNADTLKRKNDTEKLLKDRTVAAYIDPAKAEEARERGNTLFKEQKYPEAVAEYTEAIKRNPDDHRVYSNRAACYTKLAAFNEATKDAEKCIELEPTFAKGYTRKGHVEFFTKQFDKALETYQAGLAHDPNNEELKDGLRRAMVEIQKGSTGQVSEEEMKERQARAMADPEIQNILQDPVMRQVLNDFGTDPKAAAEHQKNPAVMAKVQKLINAGVVQVR